MEAARDGSLASLPLWLGDTRTTFGMATREAVKLAIERCLSKVCTIIDGARALHTTRAEPDPDVARRFRSWRRSSPTSRGTTRPCSAPCERPAVLAGRAASQARVLTGTWRPPPQ
jgi:hypothetical protein